MRVKVSDGNSYTVSGHIVYLKGKFNVKSDPYILAYDGKSLCTADSDSKEAVIEPLDGLMSLIGTLSGPGASVTPSFSGDMLCRMDLKTKDGAAVSITVPSFRYIDPAESSSGNLFSVSPSSLEADGYVVTDLR